MSNRNKQYVIAALLYVLAYVYALEIAPRVTKYASDSWLESAHRKCIVKSDTIAPTVTVGRGSSYYIGAENDPQELKTCVVTFWGATHFFLYFMLGLFTDLFWETFAVGVVFEVYEYYAYDCHDVFDIVLNSGGFLLGQTVRKRFYK